MQGLHGGDSGESLPVSSPGEVGMLDAMIAGLAERDADHLRLQWRNHLGGTAPAHLPRWLLLRALAYRLQAATLGDLDKLHALRFGGCLCPLQSYRPGASCFRVTLSRADSQQRHWHRN